MKAPLFLVILAVLGTGAAFAEDAGSAEAVLNPFTLSLTGDHSSVFALPVGDESWATGYDTSMKAPRVDSEVGLEVSQGQVGFVSRWDLRSTAEASRLRNLETALTWSPDAFRFGFGWQVYSWGSADGRNPTDNLNPRDYTTLLGAKVHKLPVLSASAVWYPTEEVSVEAVFVPAAGDSIFPTDYAESLNAKMAIVDASYALSSGLDNFVGGGRISYRSSDYDASVSYLYDLDSMYTPVVTGAYPSYTVTLERLRVQRFGADLKTTMDRFGLWAEGCLTLTGNQDSVVYTERTSRFDYTIGGDFSYGPGDNYYFNLQYTGTVVPGYDASANAFAYTDARFVEKTLVYQLAGIQEKLLQGVTWNSRWTLNDGALVPSFTGSYSLPFFYDDSQKTRFGNMLLKPELDLVPVDSFHITVGAVLAYAWIQEKGSDRITLDTSDSMGVYTSQNCVFVNVSYKWNLSLTK